MICLSEMMCCGCQVLASAKTSYQNHYRSVYCCFFFSLFYAIWLLKWRFLALSVHRVNQNCTLLQCRVRSSSRGATYCVRGNSWSQIMNKDYKPLFESVFHSCSVPLKSFRTLNWFPKLQYKVWATWKKFQNSYLSMTGVHQEVLV